MDVDKRKRSVDLRNMTEEEFNALMARINTKITEMTTEHCVKLNRMLNPYGIKVTKFKFEYEQIGEEKAPLNAIKNKTTKKKRKRKKKTTKKS